MSEQESNIEDSLTEEARVIVAALSMGLGPDREGVRSFVSRIRKALAAFDVDPTLLEGPMTATTAAQTLLDDVDAAALEKLAPMIAIPMLAMAAEGNHDVVETVSGMCAAWFLFGTAMERNAPVDRPAVAKLVRELAPMEGAYKVNDLVSKLYDLFDRKEQ